HDDGDGEILRRVRAAVGPGVPVSVSLDLHANMTPLMFEAADAMVAYRTYPHVDMADTGRRAAGCSAGCWTARSWPCTGPGSRSSSRSTPAAPCSNPPGRSTAGCRRCPT